MCGKSKCGCFSWLRDCFGCFFWEKKEEKQELVTDKTEGQTKDYGTGAAASTNPTPSSEWYEIALDS